MLDGFPPYSLSETSLNAVILPSLVQDAAIPQGARIILFVDDEPQACKYFARLFADEFTIVTSISADEAAGQLRARGPDIAVLVTDYRMPGRDGLALLEQVHREHRHVVRLLASAYADKDVVVAAVNQGRVMRILEKPFDYDQVREGLREALQLHRQRQREQDRLEGSAAAMRETLGFLAHELNTPMATVLGYLETLKSRCRADAPPGLGQIAERRAGDTLAMLGAAEQRAQYAMALLATFVQSARDAYPDASFECAPAPLRASGLVKSLLQDYPFGDGERAWVSCDLEADFVLPGQRDMLYLVLSTLTANALHALHGRREPHLRITLERCAPDAGGAAQAAIRFADTGPGIRPEILAQLTCGPVASGKGSGSGGMGVLFCRRVLESMGGSIEVRSAPGQGASITLFFKSGA